MGRKKTSKAPKPSKKTTQKPADHSHWVEFGEDGEAAPQQQPVAEVVVNDNDDKDYT